LSFARKQPLQPARIDVNELVKETTGLLEPTLGREIEIETHLSDYLWQAEVDLGQLSSAIVNLAINARDAMPGAENCCSQPTTPRWTGLPPRQEVSMRPAIMS
jgi:signal transduction histidine kinase